MRALRRQIQMARSKRIPVGQIVDRKTLSFVAGCSGRLTNAAAAHILTTASLLGDGADLILVNEQIWLTLAREADHAVVEVLDPARDGLAIVQLHGDANLFFAEEAQIERFLPGITRGGRFLTPAGGVKGRHIDIVADGGEISDRY